MTDTATDIDDSPIRSFAKNAWLYVLALGIAAIATGAIVLAWPGQTLLVLGVFFGIYLLLSGLVEIVLAFAPHLRGWTRFISVITGILSIVLGVICLRDQLESVLLLAVWIGAGWIITGIGRVVAGFASRAPGSGWSVLLGVILTLGGIVLIVYPANSIATLALVSGIWLIAIGIAQVIDAIQLKRRVGQVKDFVDSRIAN
ncbi:HdeD family acid-resistance protein [Mycobacteroides abscessus]|uniref:HdeD family acid-resistance protein n=1 Tax=Mycobacteroides abscessus TaxID=36809 RepID=UPI003AF6BD0A